MDHAAAVPLHGAEARVHREGHAAADDRGEASAGDVDVPRDAGRAEVVRQMSFAGGDHSPIDAGVSRQREVDLVARAAGGDPRGEVGTRERDRRGAGLRQIEQVHLEAGDDRIDRAVFAELPHDREPADEDQPIRSQPAERLDAGVAGPRRAAKKGTR